MNARALLVRLPTGSARNIMVLQYADRPSCVLIQGPLPLPDPLLFNHWNPDCLFSATNEKVAFYNCAVPVSL